MSDRPAPLSETLPPFLLVVVALAIMLAVGLKDPRPSAALCVLEAALPIWVTRRG